MRSPRERCDLRWQTHAYGCWNVSIPLMPAVCRCRPRDAGLHTANSGPGSGGGLHGTCLTLANPFRNHLTPLPHRIASLFCFSPQRHLTDALESPPCLFYFPGPRGVALSHPKSTPQRPLLSPQPRNFRVGRRTQSARRFRSHPQSPDRRKAEKGRKKFLRYYSFWGKGSGSLRSCPIVGFAISLRATGLLCGWAWVLSDILCFWRVVTLVHFAASFFLFFG